MNQEENILGSEKIGKLIRKFSVPCILSLLVNSLYNIVDQIFIGQKVGYLGNGATNIIFPIVIICLAIALMFGDGSSAFLSLKLGQKKQNEAGKGVGNGIILSLLISIIICIIGSMFLPQIINVFGCTPDLESYALAYGYIIIKGIPFMIIGTTLNSIIRADGSPKYAMFTMIFGAILNIILDYALMYPLNMGVQGAAIATITSQIITAILNIAYIKRFKSIKFNKSILKLDLKTCKEVVSLGISSFITEMSFVILMAFENNLLSKYGAESEFGAEIPITVLGIVMKISQILNSIIIGIAAGSQPIVGYNYGAQNFERVKKTLKYVLGISVFISTIAFVLFQAIPEKLISIFGSEGEEYVKFACMSFRIYLMLCIFNGVQIPSGIFFQAIGKSIKSVILSLSRQIALLIPAMIILGKLYGIQGVLYAGPVADALAFIIATTLLITEVKALEKKNMVDPILLVDDTSTDNKLSKHTIITISREYGSGGRYIGRLIADKLGIKFYDKDLVTELSKQTGLSEEYIENNEQKRSSFEALNNGYYFSLSNSDELFVKESELIEELAERESCVIIGRCSDFILKDNENVINIFIYSDMENKINRAVKRYGINEKEAEKQIKDIDKKRSNHYKHYTGKQWGETQNYDLCINSDALGVEKSADLICEMIMNR
ncbi:MAG: MATE family efflux transporter [Clostridia bacterium]|nr:MATE family efflux transporter [Clostridia bacterium]